MIDMALILITSVVTILFLFLTLASALLHLDTTSVHHNLGTEHMYFSAAFRGSPSSDHILRNIIWSAVMVSKWNWSTCSSFYNILHLSTWSFGGTVLGCIEEEFSLCMCLLRLQAFFAQVGILSLLQLPGLEIDPLQQSGKTTATDWFHQYVVLTLALDSLCLLKTWQETVDMESRLT